MTMRQRSADRGALLISSRSNPKIKALRALRNRKVRERTGLFFAEGLHLVAAAIQLGAAIETLVVAPELLTSSFGQEVVQAQQRAGVPCIEVAAGVFQSLAAKGSAQGVAAVVRQRWEPLRCIRLSNASCWVALDSVHYPGNLGTILRTCDAVGAGGIILLGNTTDPYDPIAVRASMGAIFSRRLVRASRAEFADWKRQHGYPVVGTSPSAAIDYQSVAYQPPLVLFMGSEPHGLARESQALCDVVVTIPMVGHSDSLNLAVAASIVLYEIFNQQRAG